MREVEVVADTAGLLRRMQRAHVGAARRAAAGGSADLDVDEGV